MMQQRPHEPPLATADLPQVDAWVDMLGGLVERHPRVWIKLGDWETELLGERVAHTGCEDPIYVCGLARSGSTILLELLARHPALATHRYRDFPPVHIPFAWSWFTERAARRDLRPRARAHRDRIAITPESPEAFEEVIWMSFFPALHDPASPAVLDAETANPEFEAFYRSHIAKLLLARGRSRYLAKSNYNVTRLAYLNRLFPSARFIVPVRDPLWHVASLMRQHRLFCALQLRDGRARNYMRRSGHFEFGLDRRPVNPDQGEAVQRILRLWSQGEEVQGWAEYWSLIYGHVRRTLAANPALAAAALVVRYEELCARPAETLTRILDHCRLPHCGLPKAAVDIVSAPSYYAPTFTAEEQCLIREATRQTARHFGYGS